MNLKAHVKCGPPLYSVKFNTKTNALVRNLNWPHRKKSLKRYLAQYGQVKIMPDCLGSVEKVPGYLRYSFLNFISTRAATWKITHEYTINDTHMEEELALCRIQYKIHWNTRLAASDIFHIFTQSIKFF